MPARALPRGRAGGPRARRYSERDPDSPTRDDLHGMYVKSLTLKGFKSFASATSLRLEPGITVSLGAEPDRVLVFAGDAR